MGEVSTAKAGDWVVFPSWKTYGADVAEVLSATPKLLKCKGWRKMQVKKSDAYACFATKAEAERLRDGIEGIAGEYHRRRKAADTDRAERVAKAAEAADKQLARLLASVDERSQSQDPQGLGPQDASAVTAQPADAQTPASGSSHAQ